MSAGLLVLGVEAPDAGVELGFLVLSLHQGGIHSGRSSALMRRPSLLWEVGVAVSAEQCQVGDSRVVAPNQVTM